MNRTSRRVFLRTAIAPRTAATADRNRHTLVVVFLRGGADTLNIVVPYGDDRYYALRPTIAIPPPTSSSSTATAIRLDDLYGLHPRMMPLVPAYREGRLAVVQAVGSDNPTGSHFEAQDQMEHGEAYDRLVGGGWLGRMLRARIGDDAGPLAAVAIGTAIPESLRGARSTCAITSIDEIRLGVEPGRSESFTNALASLYDSDRGSLGPRGRETVELLAKVERLRSQPYTPSSKASYADDAFAAGLREIARLVKAEVGLTAACVDLGGWDTHFVQGAGSGLQADAIDQLARGLAAFDADLAEHRSTVTTVVMTEFGRRISENSSAGTDHGRGFAALLLGDRVRGGRVVGEWPGLDEDEMTLIGPAGLSVRIDYRSVLADVITGPMGMPTLASVFPDFEPQLVGLTAS